LVTEGEHDVVPEVLAVAEPDLDLSLLDVTVPSETYLRTGLFEPDRMLQVIDDWSRTTFGVRQGHFARVIADMSWALPLVSPSFIGDLSDYEARATHWARSYPQTCVCMYDLDRFEGNVIMPVIKAHPKVLMCGLVVENPYFVDPVLIPVHKS
jgi:hypothetical protein